MAKIKLTGFPGRKFCRYVLPYKLARVARKIVMFEFDKNGKAEIDEKDFYPFELKRIKRAYIKEEEVKDTPEKTAPKGSVGAKAKKD